jgi:hypothetical protein
LEEGAEEVKYLNWCATKQREEQVKKCMNKGYEKLGCNGKQRTRKKGLDKKPEVLPGM